MKPGLSWPYATRSLAREGQRTLLALGCVAVGVMAIVALQLVGNMVDVGLTGNIAALNGGDIAVSGARIASAQLAYFDQLAAQGAITAYTAVTTDAGSAVGRHPVARIDRIRAVDPATFPLAGAPTFTAPAAARLDTLLSGTTVVLTRDLAQQLGIAVGDAFTLTLTSGPATTVTLGGIIANTGLFQGPQVLLARDTYTTLRAGSPAPLTYDEVYADVPGHANAAMAAVSQEIQGQFPAADVVTSATLLRSNQDQVRGIRSFLQVVALVALLIGGMGIVNTMQVLLRRRQIEIAMLKAAGYRRRDLYQLFGLEAALIGLIGGVVGAGAGIGASFVVKSFVENAFALALPTVIDAPTVAAGVAVGGATALIFGLLPIVRASQLRPQAVLRELPEGARATSRFTSAGLVLALAGLVFALALTIVRSVPLAAALVAGAAAALALLGAVFAAVTALVGRLPVAPLLPRPWRPHATMALRNLRRGWARTATTQVALFAGVFSVGVILVLGRGLQAQANQPSTAIDATVGADNAHHLAVEHQLAHTPGVTRVEMLAGTIFAVTAVNGAPPPPVASPLALSGKVEGYDLAHGQLPSQPDIGLDTGRTLTGADAGTTNVLVDRQNVDSALILALGDRITVQYTTKFQGTPPNGPSLTLTIVGFFTNNTLAATRFGNIVADSSVATRLGGAATGYDILLHVDPARADAVLTQIQAAFPGSVYVHNYADLSQEVTTYLGNAILALEAVVVPALLAALVIMANAVALAMFERRREVGILKAVGFTSRGVLAEVVTEQGIAGLTAAFLAMACAVLLSRAVQLPTLVGTASAPVQIAVSAPVVVAVVAGATILCVLVAAAVAWGATRVRPLMVLRYE